MAEDSNKIEYLMTRSDGQDEQSRLDLQHQIWLLTLNGRLQTAKLPAHVASILDIGCGTGAWAVAIANERPTSHVIGIDLTPPEIMTPPNLKIVKGDVEKDWPFGQKFDFIHGRMLASGIRDWPALLLRCWENLKPGGWLELVDICHPYRAEDPVADKDSSSGVIGWGHVAEKCWAMSGMDYRATTKHVERLGGLGFLNIYEEHRRWPLGAWSADEVEQRIGALTLENFTKFLRSAGVHIITQHSTQGKKDAQALVADAQKDLSDNCFLKRFYLTIKIHTAQKPCTYEA